MTVYPTITWISAASPGYEADLARLVASTRHLGADHRFQFHRTDRKLWKQTDKFDHLRAALRECLTTHIFWMDADCEFLGPFSVRDITQRPLTAVQHFGSTGPGNYLPPKLLPRLNGKPRLGLSWQSCLFGGTMGAMRDLLSRLAWMAEENETYDEHGLVLDWAQLAPDELQTLPCRWAAPSSFDRFPPEYHARYNARSGGLPIITHHNRTLNPGG